VRSILDNMSDVEKGEDVDCDHHTRNEVDCHIIKLRDEDNTDSSKTGIMVCKNLKEHLIKTGHKSGHIVN